MSRVENIPREKNSAKLKLENFFFLILSLSDLIIILIDSLWLMLVLFFIMVSGMFCTLVMDFGLFVFVERAVRLVQGSRYRKYSQ